MKHKTHRDTQVRHKCHISVPFKQFCYINIPQNTAQKRRLYPRSSAKRAIEGQNTSCDHVDLQYNTKINIQITAHDYTCDPGFVRPEFVQKPVLNEEKTFLE